jgi:hypothetical protein
MAQRSVAGLTTSVAPVTKADALSRGVCRHRKLHATVVLTPPIPIAAVAASAQITSRSRGGCMSCKKNPETDPLAPHGCTRLPLCPTTLGRHPSLHQEGMLAVRINTLSPTETAPRRIIPYCTFSSLTLAPPRTDVEMLVRVTPTVSLPATLVGGLTPPVSCMPTSIVSSLTGLRLDSWKGRLQKSAIRGRGASIYNVQKQ